MDFKLNNSYVEEITIFVYGIGQLFIAINVQIEKQLKEIMVNPNVTELETVI